MSRNPGDLYEPIIRSRFTDMGAILFTRQKHPYCKDFELKFRYCMEAYGEPVGFEKCKLLREDLNECMFRHKQIARLQAMDMERDRQYRAGERKKEEYYAPPPKIDSY